MTAQPTGRMAGWSSRSEDDVSFEPADYDARLRVVETTVVEIRTALVGQQRLHDARYDILRKDLKFGLARQVQGLKWLAISVAVLALLITGQITVADIMRSAASRVGVTASLPTPADRTNP